MLTRHARMHACIHPYKHADCLRRSFTHGLDHPSAVRPPLQSINGGGRALKCGRPLRLRLESSLPLGERKRGRLVHTCTSVFLPTEKTTTKVALTHSRWLRTGPLPHALSAQSFIDSRSHYLFVII
eukprot:GHVU01177559.1.p2 GENE.GHVU01177559.1~~GHVU01177559.1.p2  ORF type:complete len:139 (+),score=3.99 GHVU01177559.1:42-419(+)